MGVVLPGREPTRGATPTRGNTSSSILFLLFNLLILLGLGRAAPFTLIKLKFAKICDGKTQHYGNVRAAFAVKMRQQTPIFCWRCGNRPTNEKKMQTAAEGSPLGTDLLPICSGFSFFFCLLWRYDMYWFLPVFSHRRCFFTLKFLFENVCPQASICEENQYKRVFGFSGACLGRIGCRYVPD